MPKEKKICRKCRGEFYCDRHHILPKAIFGDGETEDLCKNCHDEFHRALGHKYLRKKNAQSEEFYLYKYYRWLAGLTVVVAVLVWLF